MGLEKEIIMNLEKVKNLIQEGHFSYEQLKLMLLETVEALDEFRNGDLNNYVKHSEQTISLLGNHVAKLELELKNAIEDRRRHGNTIKQLEETQASLEDLILYFHENNNINGVYVIPEEVNDIVNEAKRILFYAE